MASHDLIVTAS